MAMKSADSFGVIADSFGVLDDSPVGVPADSFGVFAGPVGVLDDPYGVLAGLERPASEWARGALEAISSSAPRAHLGLAENDVCEACGAQMRRGVNDLTYMCEGCGRVVLGDTANPEDDAAPHATPNTARVRIVGKGSNPYQPDLYRSSPNITREGQTEHLLKEFQKLSELFIEEGGRVIPRVALKNAANLYNYIQVCEVKRSNNKRSIMASCLHLACIRIGLAPGKSAIAAFMRLKSHGTARGDNALAKYAADGVIPAEEIKIDDNLMIAEIDTLFASLGLGDGGDSVDDVGVPPLRKAVLDVVQLAIDNNIATSSILRSKVAGATFVVLSRCEQLFEIAGRLNEAAPGRCRLNGVLPGRPRPVSGEGKLGLTEFCYKGHIRKNTVERVTKAIDAHHSKFEKCYRDHRLEASDHRLEDSDHPLEDSSLAAP